MEDRSIFPRDECREFDELLAEFRSTWPSRGFENHLIVVEIISKCGLCSEIVYAGFIELIATSNISDNELEYLKIVAALGRSVVHGPRLLCRQSIERLKVIAPHDELLTYSICDTDFE